MHETTTKRPGRAGKYIRRALLALAAVILAAVLETTAWTTFWPRAAPPTTTSCWTS